LASRPLDYDIVVVGAGPAGSRVAAGLAARGLRVAVCERQSHAGASPCCTGLVGCDAVSLLNIPPEIIQHQARGARLFSPDGSSLRVWRDEVQACVLDRPALDGLLAERAAAAGAEYFYDTTVTNIEIGRDEARVISVAGAFSAGAVVLAVGAGALTARLGLGRPGDVVIGVQAELPAEGIEEVEVYFGEAVAPGFFAWLVPVGVGRAKVGLMTRRRPLHYLRKFIAGKAAAGRIDAAGMSLSRGLVPLRPLKRTYGRRLLVVGDAAGQVKPTSGGGIYYGIICADIAAAVLAEAASGDDFSAGFLARYQRRWRQRLGAELRRGYRLRRGYERLGDRSRARLFAIIREWGIDRELAAMPEMKFDWHGQVAAKLLQRLLVRGLRRVFRRPTKKRL